MSLAIAGASARSTPRLVPSRATASVRPGLFLLYLSASSLFTPSVSAQHAGYHSRSLVSPPTCPVTKDTCPSVPGARAFHSSPQNWRAKSQFSYQVAASYSPKGRQFVPRRDTFTADVFDPTESKDTDIKKCKASIDRRKRPGSGQDAFFYSQIGTSRSTAFGVADGVGGWVDSGIDPADFSHGLCEYMACAARMRPEEGGANSLHPRDLLQVGYDEVINDDSIVGGGSTACLAVAEPEGSVEVANLGDSGFMHLGLNAVRHFTQPQTHAFNTPYQLSKTPQRMLVQMAVFGGSSALSDHPKESSITHHRVRHGEVLVFATDGVWDNLSTQDVLGVVSRTMVEHGAWVDKDGAMEVGHELSDLTQAVSGRKPDVASLQAKVAIAIAKKAKDTSHDTRRDGPFAKEVQKWYPGENWHGGKPDDIAVVVAVVVEGSAA